MSPKLGAIDGADAVVVERPHRVLARRAAAEVALGDDDARVAVGRLGSARSAGPPSRPCDSAGRGTGSAPKSSARGFCRYRAGMIWSVSKLGCAMGSATARRRSKRLHDAPRRHQLAHVGQAAGHGRGGGHGRAQQMRARPRALAADEIAVGGRGAALARAPTMSPLVPRHIEQPGVAPLEAGRREDPVEPLGFRLRLDQARARHDPGLDAGRDLAARRRRRRRCAGPRCGRWCTSR